MERKPVTQGLHTLHDSRNCDILASAEPPLPMRAWRTLNNC